MKDKILKLQEISNRYEQLKENQESVKNLLNEYQNFKIPIVFIGEFSAGKSSLINEFLREDILDVDTAPTTAKPCEICYCEKENKYKKDGVDVLELSNVNLKYYKNIKIVDLPGISSQYYEHTNVTKDYLMKKDTIFAVVIDVSKGAISEEVLSFIKNIKYLEREFILILSKIDKVEKEDAEKVLKNTLSVLKENYKEPAYYCMVSVADGKISDITDIFMKYDSKYDEIRNKIFAAPLKDLITNMKSNLENTKNILESDNVISVEKLDIGIKEIESNLPQLEFQKNMEIEQITKSVTKEYGDLLGELTNKIYENFEKYIKDHRQLSEDVNNFFSTKSQAINNKIGHIYNKAIVDLNENFATIETVNFLDGILSKGGEALNRINGRNETSSSNKIGSTMKTGDLLLDMGKLFIASKLAAGTVVTTVAGETAVVGTVAGTAAVTTVAGETAVVGAEAAATGATTAMSASVVLIPVAIVTTIVLHKLLDKFKRKTTKENIEKLLGQIKKDINDDIKTIVEDMTNEIMNKYMSAVKGIRDQLKEINSIKLDKLNEKAKINRMEQDIILLESL